MYGRIQTGKNTVLASLRLTQTLDVADCILYNLISMESPGKSDKCVRILVVDDEPVIRDLLFDMLTRRGYLVDTAEDGRCGLGKAETTSYDIVFTDIRMPGMNGVEMYRQLRKVSPESKVIIMTGFELEGMIREARGLGAFADVRKPFDLETIYELVDRVLAAES